MSNTNHEDWTGKGRVCKRSSQPKAASCGRRRSFFELSCSHFGIRRRSYVTSTSSHTPSYANPPAIQDPFYRYPKACAWWTLERLSRVSILALRAHSSNTWWPPDLHSPKIEFQEFSSSPAPKSLICIWRPYRSAQVLRHDCSSFDTLGRRWMIDHCPPSVTEVLTTPRARILT